MRRTVLTAVALMAVFAIIARADVEPWSDKWFQPPEMGVGGRDIASNIDCSEDGNYNPDKVVMDDWMCNDSDSPVTGFRWWGSYFDDAEDVSYDISSVEGFYISIHEDVPADVLPSHPGARLKEQYFRVDQLSGFCCGTHELDIGPDFYGDIVYEYFALFDTKFIQTEGEIYWVNIAAEIKDGIDRNVWGWHTSNTHNLDDAVVVSGYDPETGTYQDWYVIEGGGGDMAFEVIPEPSTLMLLIPGLGAVGMLARRRKK